MMQNMKKTKNKKQCCQYVIYLLAVVVGLVLGIRFEDKQGLENSVFYYVNNNNSSNKDTVVVHDTIYKKKISVKWRYKKSGCCCHKRYDRGTKIDSI